ncbi:MAG: MAPEG family protein [Polyangiaceae bacterium]
MNSSQSSALWWLAASVLLTAVMWMPYIVNRILEHGVWPALRNPNHDQRPRAAWADRLMWAHQNAVENLVVFAPLVIAAHVLGASAATTATAAAVYFFARLAHVVIYAAGIPLLRTLAFLVGFGAQVTVAVAVFGAAT